MTLKYSTTWNVTLKQGSRGLLTELVTVRKKLHYNEYAEDTAAVSNGCGVLCILGCTSCAARPLASMYFMQDHHYHRTSVKYGIQKRWQVTLHWHRYARNLNTGSNVRQRQSSTLTGANVHGSQLFSEKTTRQTRPGRTSNSDTHLYRGALHQHFRKWMLTSL